MLDKVKQMFEMKKQADQLKKALDAITIESSEVRGMKIVMTGSQTIQSIELDQGLLNPDNKKRFENDLMRSVNVAIRKSQNVAAQKMKIMMPGGFPGL